MKLQGDWRHVLMRASERISSPYVGNAAKRLEKDIKDHKMPNCEWYRTFFSNTGEILCYVCGFGILPTTVLNADMIPHGKKV